MNLHEYQAKALLNKFNIPVPSGVVVQETSEVAKKITELSGNRWVAKVQIHAGGRGQSGGVKLIDSLKEVERFVADKIGTNLRTHQTTQNGQPINEVLIEQCFDIERELYLAILIDRNSQKLTLIVSTEGGMDIEKISHEHPQKLSTITINPIVGLMPFQSRHLAFKLKLSPKQSKQFVQILNNLVQLFLAKDLSLLEINPLVCTKNGDLVCLDAKINIDNNALYRQTDLLKINDIRQEDIRELEANNWDLNYVSLNGTVGCMVNGAGLAMATMDLVKLHGGTPANFLDVGGSTTAERVAKALEIIVSDTDVKSVLVNIFGGIVRCDLIADGIITAINKTKITLPLVIRLAGNNAKLGLEKLQLSGLNITVFDELTDAVQQAILLAKNKK